MGEFLFGVAELAAVVIFIYALLQGKGFWNALRMSVGVLILGVVAVIAMGLLNFAFSLTYDLLRIAVYGLVVYAVVILLGKALKGSETGGL